MKKWASVWLVASLMSGCATYRITSNIPASSGARQPAIANVLVVTGELPNQHYREIGPIEVTVRKGNPFVAAPTQQQANSALIQKAQDIGAEAVIRVTYESGFDVVTWGHISAKGVGVQFSE